MIRLSRNSPTPPVHGINVAFVLLFVLTLFVHQPAFAMQSSAPQTATTESATTQPSSPREAFASFFSAMAHGKPDQITPLCFAADDESRNVVADFRDVSTAIAELRKTVIAKFGDAMADAVLPQMAVPDDSEQMKQTITGDKAVLESLTLGETVLVRADGQWKLDVAALRSSGNLPPNAHAYFSQLAAAIRATAGDVQNGRFDNPVAAREALRARQEGIREDASATQSSGSTQPATMP